MPSPIDLPMAIADCGLDAAGLQQQVARYRELGAHAVVRRRSPLKLTVEFAVDPDPKLLRSTIDTERECCSFFVLDYAATARRLTVSVSDRQRRAALDAIQAALTTRADL